MTNSRSIFTTYPSKPNSYDTPQFKTLICKKSSF